MSEANKMQVGGEHYKSSYQHWDWAIDVFGASVLKYAATKYLTRWKKKDGLKDLNKARHYVVKLMECHALMDVVQPDNLGARKYDATFRYIADNEIDGEEAVATLLITRAIPGSKDLEEVLSVLDGIIANASRSQYG